MITRSLIGLCAVVAIFAVSPVPAQAALITYTSFFQFSEAAPPGLQNERFESGLVGPGHFTSCQGPVSGATASACFPQGGLLSGVTYSATHGSLVVLDGFGDLPLLAFVTKVFGPNNLGDTLTMTFESASAVGFNLFPGFFIYAHSGRLMPISIFDPAGAPLGNFTIFAPFEGIFFGVVSDDALIGRIDVSVLGGSNFLVDNVNFGAPVPEPASAMLVGLGLGLTALVARRRRSSRTPAMQTRLPEVAALRRNKNG